MSQFDARNIVTHLALQLLDVIRPRLGSEPAGQIVGEAKSGDYTFSIDDAAEQMLEPLIDFAGRRSGVRLAYYSEDRGLVTPVADPQYVLVIDPIDGTRPALCGFESCCISVAMAPLNSDVVTFSEIEAAVLIELSTGSIISAQKDREIFVGSATSLGSSRKIDASCLAKKTDLSRLFWAYEVCARPSRAVCAILGDLIDRTSFGGGAFVLNSSSYAVSRVVLGQLDAYVDPFAAVAYGPAGEKWLAHARSLYGGKVFGLFAYDIAAAAFLAQQQGAVVTDAHGKSLNGINLLASGSDHVLSCVVAANQTLATAILKSVEEGLQRAVDEAPDG